MRLNKYIASAGIASRRKADGLIKNGNVKVNGAVTCELGSEVNEGDVVEVNGITIKPQTEKIYLMLNKPTGYITSTKDEKGRPVITDLVTDIEERLFPVGRLDYDTSGLIIMTNDGEAANRLAHPKYRVPKTYKAKVAGILSDERLARLRSGVDIGGFTTSRARVDVVKQTGSYTVAEITIQEGKNRQIRKMFAAVGNKVLELERIAVGELILGRLKPGDYRKLTSVEVGCLLKN